MLRAFGSVPGLCRELRATHRHQNPLRCFVPFGSLSWLATRLCGSCAWHTAARIRHDASCVRKLSRWSSDLWWELRATHRCQNPSRCFVRSKASRDTVGTACDTPSTTGIRHDAGAAILGCALAQCASQTEASPAQVRCTLVWHLARWSSDHWLELALTVLHVTGAERAFGTDVPWRDAVHHRKPEPPAIFPWRLGSERASQQEPVQAFFRCRCRQPAPTSRNERSPSGAGCDVLHNKSRRLALVRMYFATDAGTAITAGATGASVLHQQGLNECLEQTCPCGHDAAIDARDFRITLGSAGSCYSANSGPRLHGSAASNSRDVKDDGNVVASLRCASTSPRLRTQSLHAESRC